MCEFVQDDLSNDISVELQGVHRTEFPILNEFTFSWAPMVDKLVNLSVVDSNTRGEIPIYINKRAEVVRG